MKLTKRLGNNAYEILDGILAEKVIQMYHLEVQQYVREKEPNLKMLWKLQIWWFGSSS